MKTTFAMFKSITKSRMQLRCVLALAGTFLAASQAFAGVTVNQMGIGFGFASLTSDDFETDELDQSNPEIGSTWYAAGSLGGVGFMSDPETLGTYSSSLTYTSNSTSSMTMHYASSFNVRPYAREVLDLLNRDYGGAVGTLEFSSLTDVVVTLTSSSFTTTDSGNAFFMRLSGEPDPTEGQWGSLSLIWITQFYSTAGPYSFSILLGAGNHLLAFGAGAPNAGGSSDTSGFITVTQIPGPSVLAVVGAFAIAGRRRRCSTAARGTKHRNTAMSHCISATALVVTATAGLNASVHADVVYDVADLGFGYVNTSTPESLLETMTTSLDNDIDWDTPQPGVFSNMIGGSIPSQGSWIAGMSYDSMVGAKSTFTFNTQIAANAFSPGVGGVTGSNYSVAAASVTLNNTQQISVSWHSTAFTASGAGDAFISICLMPPDPVGDDPEQPSSMVYFQRFSASSGPLDITMLLEAIGTGSAYVIGWGSGSGMAGGIASFDGEFTVTTVPAPGAAALIGLAGLVATRRRRN